MLLHLYAKLARSAHVAQSVTDTHLLYFNRLSVTLKGLSYLLRSHLWLYSTRRLFVTKELSNKDGEVPESLEANLVDECGQTVP